MSFDVASKQPLLKKILDIIDKRLVNQMDHPLYGAALYLNPRKLLLSLKTMMMPLLGS